MNSTILQKQYGDLLIELRGTIDAHHLVGTEPHNELHTCVDAISELMLTGLQPITAVDVTVLNGERDLAVLREYRDGRPGELRRAG